MSFDYKKSHAAPKGLLLADPPSYAKIISDISKAKMDKMYRAYFGCLIMLGARTTELLRTTQSNYKFFDIHMKDLDLIETKNLNIPTEFDSVKITMRILKQNKERYKTITCVRNVTFQECFDWLVDYFRTLPVDPKARVFPISRGQAWWECKRTLGDGYWNHLFRHVVASNDIMAGIGVSLVQSKLGHKSMSSMDTYLHMRTKDLDDALRKAYGDKLEKFPSNSPGPLNPNQLMGGIAAVAQIGEKVTGLQKRKDAIIQLGDKQIVAPIQENARNIRDRLRENNPELVKQKNAEVNKYWESHKKPFVKKPEIDYNELVAVV